MKHHRIFGLFPSPAPQVTFAIDYLGYFPKGDTAYMDASAQFWADEACKVVAVRPPGKRVVQIRWMMRYETESGPPFHADPLPVFENGGYDVSTGLRMMRPFGRMLRQRKLFLDGIFCNCEGGFGFFSLSPDQMKAIFASSKARAKMPPIFRNIRPEQVTWWTPEFDRELGIKWNRWQMVMINTAFRKIFIDSGIFKIPRKSGPPVNPVVCNFHWFQTTWPVMDNNGWPIRSVAAIDRRTSSPGMYFAMGNRYRWRNHHYLWNIMVDHINWARSCMNRNDARLWTTIQQMEFTHPWIFQKTVEHVLRTGVSWTTTRSAWVYFNAQPHMRPVSDTFFGQLLAANDRPFPRVMGLPELQIDCDRIESPGLTTTYEEFLDNVDLDQYPIVMDSGDPLRIQPNQPLRAVA